MTTQERQRVLDAYATLRVADVRDGMDTLGLHRVGSMSPTIRPLWRTRTVGLARTVRYVAYDGPAPKLAPEECWQWVGTYYRDICPYPWMDEIEPGDFIVIDASGVDAGLMGSENTLTGLRRGARGYVTSGGVRDTDEVILQKVPFWTAMCSQSMVQARLKYDTRNCPVVVGGVTVHPADVVVADGDGVIVVPHDAAMEVAHWAGIEHKRDMAVRRDHYKALGLKPDETVGQ